MSERRSRVCTDRAMVRWLFSSLLISVLLSHSQLPADFQPGPPRHTQGFRFSELTSEARNYFKRLPWGDTRLVAEECCCSTPTPSTPATHPSPPGCTQPDKTRTADSLRHRVIGGKLGQTWLWPPGCHGALCWLLNLICRSS
jgi:hypothetical protein